MKTKIQKLACLCCLSAGISVLPVCAQDNAQEIQFDIQAKQSLFPVQSTMYGVFFEDINFGADGGIYAELVKNRSFEFQDALMGWIPFGTVKIEEKDPCFERNPHYVRLSFGQEITQTGLENEGFKGMGIKAGESYFLSTYARVQSKTPVRIRIELISESNHIFETKELTVTGNDWKKYQVTLTPQQTEKRAHLRLTLIDPGTIDMDHISLFPENTYKKRPNGLRADLVEALKDLHPGIFRFPGGCIVEGTTRATRYQWKNTIGPVENRPTNINRWFYTFSYRKFPDYYQSLGLGFYEYFLLSEDIGAEPLPVLNCGLSCQYENDDMDEHARLDELQPYIQDALDLIEFANGSASSKWGKIRAEMGHPAPFNLKFIAIGNEQWGSIYVERLKPFVEAIRAKYPDIKIVGGSGPQASGEEFDYLWSEMKNLQVDLVDEHYYRHPEWFLSNAKRYDSYDRNAPKVFAGEYACHTDTQANSFLAALCEAAFMTGLERNADVVQLCTYAPLFAHVDAWQWRPDLIWFDNLSVFKTPNYYVQQMYSRNKGTDVVKLTRNNQPVAGENDLYASAALDKQTNELIIKVVNTGMYRRSITWSLEGFADGKRTAKVQSLQSLDLGNTQLVPTESSIELDVPKAKLTIKPFSFSVYRIPL